MRGGGSELYRLFMAPYGAGTCNTLVFALSRHIGPTQGEVSQVKK